jgi:hypothetical protein
MLKSIKYLFGYRILAEDGVIGKVDGFYFEDVAWTIRYLVVDTSDWFIHGRKVLISPAFFGEPDWQSETFPVLLTKEKIENSPRADVEKPIPRQYQIGLDRYYGWRAQWPAGDYFESSLSPAKESEQMDEIEINGIRYPHLRSAKEVFGYYIQASDDGAGRLDDLIVDNGNWIIRYLVADTSGELIDKMVLVPSSSVREINWSAEKVLVNLSRDLIKDSPAYDPSVPFDKEYENQLNDYYTGR